MKVLHGESRDRARTARASARRSVARLDFDECAAALDLDEVAARLDPELEAAGLPLRRVAASFGVWAHEKRKPAPPRSGAPAAP